METSPGSTALASLLVRGGERVGFLGGGERPAASRLALLTVSDHIRRHEHLSSEERRTSFDAMIGIALDAAIAD